VNNSINFATSTAPSYPNGIGNYSDNGNAAAGVGQRYNPEDSQYMYYPTSSNNDPNAQVTSQQQINYNFPPNIFDMESVYWNETMARNPMFSDTVSNMAGSQGNSMMPMAVSQGPALPTSMPSVTSGTIIDASNQNGLQMLAHATTAGMQQVSPFTFNQEPSQPEWNDVINMLQLPPAFLS
jgi:hypothetical protein